MDFEQAYDEHLRRVYAFLAYRTGSRADAEDLTQQTFERAWRSWARFDSRRSKVSTWLISIAHNLLIDHYRARTSQLEDLTLESLDPDMLGTSNGNGANLGLEPDLAQALSRLSDREREVLALRYGGDLRTPEIAQVLGLSVANVQQITSRSLRRLREGLGGHPPNVRQKTEIWTEAGVLESPGRSGAG